MSRRSRLAARPRLERLDERCVLSALTPTLLNTAYGLNAITHSNGAVNGNGVGQTIAIIDTSSDPTIVSDLAAFDQKYGIRDLITASQPAVNGPASAAPGSLSVDNLAGSYTDASWNQEEALDVEWAHATAPGANIVLVEAASAGTGALIAAVNLAKQIPSVSVISMSWGSEEFAGETSYDGVFTTPAGHAGITFLASAGDGGAGTEWPASSPNVVSVGGTSLIVNASGTRLSETSWSGTGGGSSRYESEPSYQSSVQSSGRRSMPDVAAVADPSTGVIVVSGGKQVQVGGTSLSSPIWGGLVAIADQGLVLAGKSSLDGATQTLPKLYAAPSSSFNDITSGTGNRATTGYDTATGLGTPHAQNLVPFLVNDTTSPPGGTTTTTTTVGTTTTTTTVGTTTGGTTTTTTTGGTTTGGTTTGGGSRAGGGSTPVTPPKPPQRWQPPSWWTHWYGSKSH